MKALSKLQNQNISTRPVINSTNSPNYKESKFITNVLKENINIENIFAVRNSLKPANKLKYINIAGRTNMVSFL